jgi:type II secretion system protein G
MKINKGFTIIELIVVIAIIAVLAGIVLTNVSQYIEKSKVTRANTDVADIEKALELFYVQYGDYPWGQTGLSRWTQFYSSAAGGTGDPYLTVNSCLPQNCPHLSNFYKSDWVNYNASYFVPNGYYYVTLSDGDGDNKIGCGYVEIDAGAYNYGRKYILCHDCDCNNPSGSAPLPFKTTHY